jgi:hypothetical protein
MCIVQCKRVKEEHILGLSENRVLERILGSKEEIMGGWRKL